MCPGLPDEKRHWENQIIALGGANYHHNVAMVDGDGREVPSTKGYKCIMHIHFWRLPLKTIHVYRYFSWEKDLPDVKEIFRVKRKKRSRQIRLSCITSDLWVRAWVILVTWIKQMRHYLSLNKKQKKLVSHHCSSTTRLSTLHVFQIGRKHTSI